MASLWNSFSILLKATLLNLRLFSPLFVTLRMSDAKNIFYFDLRFVSLTNMGN